MCLPGVTGQPLLLSSVLIKTTFLNTEAWNQMCRNQIEWGVRNGRTDNDSYFDKLWFGKPHSCYETHSVFKSRVKRSLDHSFKTVPGTIRHWWQTNTTDKFAARKTQLRQFVHSSVTHHYSGTWSFQWTWHIRTLGALWGRSSLGACGNRTPADFLLEKKKDSQYEKLRTAEKNGDLGWVNILAKSFNCIIRDAKIQIKLTFQIFRCQCLSFHDMRGQSLVHIWMLARGQEVQQVLVHKIRLKHTKCD